MPKKKKGKGKKKKRSKEDLEREEAERLERERRIAEEKAAADALEKKKQAEERKRRQEEAAQRRFEELRRLEAEEKEFIPQDEKKRKLLAVEMAKLSKQLEWDAYLNDDGTPDPSDEPQLNTMMSEWEEDEERDLPKVIDACVLAHKVLHAIDILISRAVSQAEWHTAAKYKSYRLLLESQITRKLDVATSFILSRIDEFAAGKQSKQLSAGGDSSPIKYGLWMNIHAVARYRPIEVDFSVNMGLTIPKSLILNLLAARMTCFRYAHVSGLFTAENVETESSEMEIKMAKEAHEIYREKRKNSFPDGIQTNAPAYIPRLRTSKDGSRVDIANTEYADIPEDLQTPFREQATLACKWKKVHERSVSLKGFGSTLVVELLGLPAVAKRLKRWTLRQLTEEYDNKVNRLNYPLDGTAATILQPIKVYFELAEDTLLRGTPRIGWWNSETQDWEDEGITEIKLEAPAGGSSGNGIIRFHTVHVGHFRLVQPRDVDVPYHYWEAKPHGSKGDLMLVIHTKHQASGGQREVKISISSDGCTLLSPQDKQLKSIFGIKMKPRELLSRLAFSGICLALSDDDATEIDGVNPKNMELEKRMHADIASLAMGFHLSKSKWNQERSGKETVFRVREQEVEHSFTVLATYDPESKRGVKCSLTKTKETSKKFHTTAIDGEMTHSRLWNCLNGRCTAETATMVETGNVRVVDHLRTLLDITRPLTFA